MLLTSSQDFTLRRLLYGALSVLGLIAAPILYYQGKKVRANPKLPEAGGPRTGHTGTTLPAKKLLVLGDSSAVGVGARDQHRSLVGCVADGIAEKTKQSVQWEVVAKSGVTCLQLNHELLPTIKGEQFDYVVIAIGANNVLAWSSAKAWLRQLNALDQTLTQRFHSAQILYSGLPPMHQFSALRAPLQTVLGWRCRYLDIVLKQWCHQNAQRHYLPIAIKNDTRLLATDGFHPSEKGYQAWGVSVVNFLLDTQA